MPGFELFGEAEKKEVQDVLNSGVLMRYGFDGLRQGHWKAKDLEKEIAKLEKVKETKLPADKAQQVPFIKAYPVGEFINLEGQKEGAVGWTKIGEKLSFHDKCHGSISWILHSKSKSWS
mgnify:CR=1 FL=1